MKSSFFLIAISFIFCLGCRQSARKEVKIIESIQPINIPFIDDDEIRPSYPGGMTNFYNYLIKHIKYPKKAQENKIEGKVILNFIVEKDGKVANIKIIKSPSVDLSNEAIRVLKDIVFIPGKVDKKSVRMVLQIPISFELDIHKRNK